MKLPTLSPLFIAFMLLGVGSVLAAADSGFVMTPLSPGPILPQLPDMCAWKILFSYKNDLSSVGKADNAGKSDPGTEGLPRTVSIIQTKPLWHSMIITMDGKSTECWGSADICYLVRGAGGKPTVLRKNPVELVAVPSAELDANGRPLSVTMKTVGGNFEAGADGKYLFNPAQGDFQDMEWLSPQTYVGSQQGALIFRQQSPDGITEVRLRADTHFPISWQKGNETRTFQLLPAPQDPLVMPPDVARVAAEFQRVEALLNGTPRQRIIPPLAQPSGGNTPGP